MTQLYIIYINSLTFIYAHTYTCILNITYSVYANRKVPDTWKNKMNYSNDMLNMLSKDTSLIKYLGKGNGINQKRPVTAK